MTRDPDRSTLFDHMAEGYESSVERNPSMVWMRRRVYRALEPLLPGGGRILDLGCGAGADTVHLARSGCEVLAVDCSAGMIAATRERVTRAGLLDRVELRRMEIERVGELVDEGGETLQGVLSNFGALNTVADLPELASPLHELLAPGGWLAICFMGRRCPWDWLVEAGSGRFREIRGRRRREGVRIQVGEGAITTYFPTPREVRAALVGFELVSCQALGVLLPPPRVTAGRGRRERLWELLDRLERSVATWPLIRGLGDHTLMILRRA